MAVKKAYYAYFFPGSQKSGVAASWKECEQLVKGKDARYRGFALKSEAMAWLAAGAPYEAKERVPAPKLVPGIYFDAGTGRGNGVEVKVTDEKGRSLLGDVLPKSEITRFETFHITDRTKTNNYGELLGCYLAMQIALKKGIRPIFGDSRLVVMYWSKGILRKDKVAHATKELCHMVHALRKDYEAAGGKIGLVSGDHNPADLGFHRA